MVSKTFKTIEYEGSNGWQVSSIASDSTGADLSGAFWSTSFDRSSLIYSYTEGKYDSAGTAYPNATVPPFYWAGFHRKENKYVANLVNNSLVTEGEIIWGNNMSGIKGYIATVTMTTDTVTDPGGEKELFAVGANYEMNSGY